MLCLLYTLLVVGSPLRPVSSQPWILGQIYIPRNVFPPTEWALIRKQLVIPITLMPLLHLWAQCVILVTMIVHRVHSLVRPLMTSSPPRPLQHYIVPSNTTKARQQWGVFLVSMSCDQSIWLSSTLNNFL